MPPPIIEPPREPIEKPPRDPIEKPRICACDAVVMLAIARTAIAAETDSPTSKRLSDERMAKPPSKPTSNQTATIPPARRPDCGGFGAALSSPWPRSQSPGSPPYSSQPR